MGTGGDVVELVTAGGIEVGGGAAPFGKGFGDEGTKIDWTALIFDSGGVRDGTLHDVIDAAGSKGEIRGSDCDWPIVGFKFIFPIISAEDFEGTIGKIEEVMTFADVMGISGVERSHNVELLETGHWFAEKIGNWRRTRGDLRRLLKRGVEFFIV